VSVAAEEPGVRAEFFVAGGTLRADAACYVARRADNELFRALSQGQFCYVLNARQIGKSSLMVQTTSRLRQEGAKVAVLDLTSIGRNVTTEQWYFGLLTNLGGQLGMSKALTDFWGKNAQWSPLQRWFEAIEKVILPTVETSLVIFIDEIDYIRSLPFPTDEFFAAIRDCYNRRATNPEYNRLTFCLLGVATPAELIADPRMTPFNVGRRIELADFTLEESVALTEGLESDGRSGTRLLARIMRWTGGHPYLTQRLCSAVAEDPAVRDGAGVDRLCEQLFLNDKARTVEDNFAFVRHRLLASSSDSISLLDLYDQVLRGKVVRDEEADALVSLLKLSGVVRSVQGRLQIRNNIYRRVFDRKWVKENMPEAERRRAKRAFWRGLSIAGGAAILVSGIIGAAAFKAVQLQHRAEDQAKVAIIESKRVAAEREDLRRQMYAAQMRFADLAFKDQNIAETRGILESLIPRQGLADYRGFEWGRLWRLTSDRSTAVLQGLRERPYAVAISPTAVYAGGDDGSVTMWSDARTSVSAPAPSSVRSLALSPDSKMLAVGTADGRVALMRAADLGTVDELSTGQPDVRSVAFLGAGKMLATLTSGGQISTWDLASGKKLHAIALEKPLGILAASPDGKSLAVAGLGFSFHTAMLDLAPDGSLTERYKLGQGGTGIAFSPDGTRLFMGDSLGTVFVANANTGKVEKTLKAVRNVINGLVPIGKDHVFIASSGRDAMLLNVANGRSLVLPGHTEGMAAAAWDPTRKEIATASLDLTVRLWKDIGRNLESPFAVTPARIRTLVFSRDGKQLLSGESDGRITLREFPSGKVTWTTKVNGNGLQPVDIDPTEAFVAAGTLDGRVEILDAKTGQQKANLKDVGIAVQKVLFSPDGRYLLALGSKDKGQVYEVQGWKPLKSIDLKNVAVSDAAWGQGSTYAIASTNKGLLRGDAGGNVYIAAEGHYSSVAFSADGSLLAAGKQDGGLHVWNIAGWTERSADVDAPGAIVTLAFSPDMKTLVGSGEGGTIHLWNVSTLRSLGSLPADSVITRTLAFSPDGVNLVSGGSDSTLRLWRSLSVFPTNSQLDIRDHKPSVQ
jgi:WD40 repeat protein